MTPLVAGEYEFKVAPLEHGLDVWGNVESGPPGPDWELVQVIPLTSGGGSYFTGPAGQDHRIGSVGTAIMGLFARKKPWLERCEKLAARMEWFEWHARKCGHFDLAVTRQDDVRRVRAGEVAMRQ